ncbi:hypothetical protein HMI54_005252 [Coelomomyces lativittatus]|nr:hypothetical protein HMI54_005252 [Coelomomyces lativittatus]KAJ1506475.1 hypothetical protein HMI55_001166 [Coelomomyces lativittatus]KAJ1509021.1 hypothetical protein HMI56_007001 [Coelomomyces lativittatus]
MKWITAIPLRFRLSLFYGVISRSTSSISSTPSHLGVNPNSSMKLKVELPPISPSYPSFSWDPPLTASQFMKEYGGNRFQPNEKDEKQVHVAGRIAARRESSANLMFLTLFPDKENIALQMVISKKRMQVDAKAWEKIKCDARIGSHHYFSGFPGKTGTGHVSVFVNALTCLTPALQPLPLKCDLKHSENRVHVRSLEFLVNPHLRHCLRLRSHLIHTLRTYLHHHGYMETETPILASTANGACATPFQTVYGHRRMYLRIAPELFLKQMVIGGFDRVYEVGKVFRHESMDASHHPEFTLCEAYMAYTSFSSLFPFLESMLQTLVQSIPQSSLEVVKTDGTRLDFRSPFRRIHVVDYLEQHVGPLPDLASDVDTLRHELCLYYEKHSVPLPPFPHTTSRLFEKLIELFIEPKCIQPTFLIGHPIFLSPLAKGQLEKPALSARTELFVDGKELINGYEELNDPFEQRKRFQIQLREQHTSKTVVSTLDDDYCHALEYGLPPTVGWGMGIDRLCMLLTQSTHIREILPFPLVHRHTPSEV